MGIFADRKRVAHDRPPPKYRFIRRYIPDTELGHDAHTAGCRMCLHWQVGDERKYRLSYRDSRHPGGASYDSLLLSACLVLGANLSSRTDEVNVWIDIGYGVNLQTIQ